MHRAHGGRASAPAVRAASPRGHGQQPRPSHPQRKNEPLSGIRPIRRNGPRSRSLSRPIGAETTQTRIIDPACDRQLRLRRCYWNYRPITKANTRICQRYNRLRDHQPGDTTRLATPYVQAGGAEPSRSRLGNQIYCPRNSSSAAIAVISMDFRNL